MSFSDIEQNDLEERLKFAWKVLNEIGPEGAYTRQIAPEILKIANPSKSQARTVGMTMKALAARGMAEVVEEEGARKKDASKWRAVDPKKWYPINAGKLRSEKIEADHEQSQWYHAVISECRIRKQFRAMMADRL